MTLKSVFYANQNSCLIVIACVSDVDRTASCYREGAPHDQLNNGFKGDQNNSDFFFLKKLALST